MGGDSSLGELVPTLRQEASCLELETTSLAQPSLAAEGDRDMLCPICMKIIENAFLSACGHSFCYTCIFTHLSDKSDCPCCARYLTPKLVFPNILLNKLLERSPSRQNAKHTFAFEHLRQGLIQSDGEMSAKELDVLMSLVAEKKGKREQEEAETNMCILLDFLRSLRKQNLECLDQTQKDLQSIEEDIVAVERQVHQSTDRVSSKLGTLADDPNSEFNFRSVPMVTRKSWVHAQFSDLQECYLQKRRNWDTPAYKKEKRDMGFSAKEGCNPGLEDFQSVLASCTRYSRFRVAAELRHEDLFHAANIVSSIEFDRDEELFATAGVSRRIKVFDFSVVMNEPADAHCPVVEMTTRSKLSCLSWNKYMKSHIACSDYEGVVTVWDITTRQSVMEYKEHEKRAWSVDFLCTEPSMLVSGSDDCKVKIWCTNQETSALSIDMEANACSVKYNPVSSMHLAIGSADHRIYYYDLRNISHPLFVFNGHQKAISYVRFLSANELASASTDSSLRLWDVKENLALRTYRGHKNQKNFAGLTVNSEYLACGSETDQVFLYHKAISRPAVWYRFDSDMEAAGEDDDGGSHFVSAVCWKNGSPTMIAANSQGTIKVLVLAA